MKRWTLRKTCSCPSVWECPDCHTQLPADVPALIAVARRCACDDSRDAIQRAQAEAGEKYWKDIGPIIETWNLEDPR